MAQIKPLLDEYGVIREAIKILPEELKIDFLEALAELEDNECLRKRTFLKTRLHQVTGIRPVRKINLVSKIVEGNFDRLPEGKIHLIIFNNIHIVENKYWE